MTVKAISQDFEARRLKALRRFCVTSSLITFLGHAVLGFEQSYATPFVGCGTAYAVTLFLEWLRAKHDGARPRYSGGLVPLINFLLPAHIVGLTCSMFLYPGARFWPTIFAATAAICSKYLLQVRVEGRERHVLNPSNAGILAAMVLFPEIGIVLPYQFHSGLNDTFDVIFPLAIFAAGAMLNAQLTRKIPLITAWIGAFVLQALLRHWLSGAELLAMIGPITGTVAVMFTFYMITDPSTTPQGRWGQVAFGSSIGLVYGALVSMHVVFGLFWALILTCTARGLYHAALPYVLPSLTRWTARVQKPAPITGSSQEHRKVGAAG